MSIPSMRERGRNIRTAGGGVDKFMDMSGGGCDVLMIGGAPLLTGVRGRTWLDGR